MASLNGAFRQFILLDYFSNAAAHQLSTLMLMVIITVYAVIIFPGLRVVTLRQAWVNGMAWLILTMIFEFTLGLSAGNSLQSLLKAYDVPNGELWPLVLLLMLVIQPVLFWRRIKVQ